MDPRAAHGFKAANNWLARSGYTVLESPELSASADSIYGIKLDSSKAEEVLAFVVTEKTIATSYSRDLMCRAVDWRQDQPDMRRAVLFVPMGYLQNARELLGMYDEFVEFFRAFFPGCYPPRAWHKQKKHAFWICEAHGSGCGDPVEWPGSGCSKGARLVYGRFLWGRERSAVGADSGLGKLAHFVSRRDESAAALVSFQVTPWPVSASRCRNITRWALGPLYQVSRPCPTQ